MVSVYSVSEDGSKIEGTMDSVEILDAQSLVDLLVQYGVLDNGTKAVSFTTEGSVASQEAGPGVTADATMAEKATLELGQFPSENQEKVLAGSSKHVLREYGYRDHYHQGRRTDPGRGAELCGCRKIIKRTKRDRQRNAQIPISFLMFS